MATESDSNVFSLRIVSLDYYMAPPIPDLDVCYSPFHGQSVVEVPVIRIYGSTLAGQKACLHIHRALPYLYVPCSDILPQIAQEGHAYMELVSSTIENALKFKGSTGSRRQHVHSCCFVRARRFYGYHSSEELFMKGGAVLNRCFQPHESHIPFLLQFLIDYNLYGMGHIRLSRVKFRHPLPEEFIPRPARFNNKFSHDRENMVCSSGRLKRDSSGAVHGYPVIWLSSTVASDWKWEFPITEHGGSSLEHGIHLIKRQSTCELEGDAAVDEILNQHDKTCTSLSQASSEVNMVQSLIPIWQEQARSGIQEKVDMCDPSKPPPEHVLKSFYDGLEFENTLLGLSNEVQNTLSVMVSPSTLDQKLLQCTKPSNEMCGLIAGGGHMVNSCNSHSESVKFLVEGSSQVSVPPLGPSGEDDGAIPPELGHQSPRVSPIDAGLLSFETTGTTDSKVLDVEALGLLRWLASSQAVEDIHTDDELVNDVVLSPLLPTPTIGKVLEKAHQDYESESQKECQDILDSVEDSLKFEDLKEQETYSESNGVEHLAGISSKDVIPQVDGLWDEKFSSHSSGNSAEGKLSCESERKPPCPVSGDASAGKMNKSLWGCLPLSSKGEINVGSECARHRPLGACSQGTKNVADTSSSARNEADEIYDASIVGAVIGTPSLKEGKKLAGYSVRDLMRRKRCYQVEPSERGSHGGNKVSRRDLNDGTFSSPKQLESHIVESHKHVIRPSETPHLESSAVEAYAPVYNPGTCSKVCGLGLSSCDVPRWRALLISAPDKSEIHDSMLVKFDQDEENRLLMEGLEKKQIVGSSCLMTVSAEAACFLGTDVTYKNDQEGADDMEGIPSVPLDSHAKASTSLAATSAEFVENDTSRAQVSRTCAPEPDRTSNEVLNTEKFFSEDIEMTFNMKPPTAGQANMNFEDASLARATHDVDFVGNVNNAADSLACRSALLSWKHANDLLPFFIKAPHERKKVCDKYYKYEGTSRFHQDTVLGVPTHYQNDGSALFLLTPVLSPPSFACVSQWISQLARQDKIIDPTGILKGNLPLVPELPEPTFLKDNVDFMNEQYGNSPNEPQEMHAALSGDLINTNGFLEDADSRTFFDSRCSTHAKPMLDHSSQETHWSTKVVSEVINTEAETKPPSKGVCSQEKGWSEHWQEISQISGPSGRSKLTPLSQIGFRDPASVGAGQQLTLLSIEVHAESRGDLRPDPRYDAVSVIALAVQEDMGHIIEVCVLLCDNNGKSCQRNLDAISGCKVVIATEEKDLLDQFVKLICSLDPDILLGWEIQGASLGFLAERAAHLGINLLKNISRTPVFETKEGHRDLEDPEIRMPNNLLLEGLIPDVLEGTIIEDEWGRTHTSGLHVGGRIVLNIWRIMRAELKLNMHNLEVVAEAVLRRKIPSIPCRTLSQWFSSGPGRARFRCIEHFIDRSKLNLEIMNQLDMINRTAELARVFGIDFYSVLSRGSQYRVESMLLRLVHTQNYLAISPSSQQVASQPAMECLPLVMEPESGFYADPVVVLDFQSLYPSMIIAYNLCFCTCLGKVVPAKPNVLGVSSFTPDPQLLSDLKHQILVTPNGVMFVPSKVRKGVLPRLLEELLSTRIMVKKAIKKLATSEVILQRIFNARQLALKLIANVTYGYTAAGFSGRMPCAELADSIVQCGRRTLEKAISFVNAHEEWNARVIYGDTDSMFVLLKGRTREESFRIGQEIASAVTAINPSPVTLKMEKVYHPCFLLTKKRYVGYSFESPDQDKPTFDAKGIETVRRDTCPAVAKTLEQSLRLFFECQEILKVKSYLLRQWTRILSGKVSLQDFVFAKEVRLGTYSARASSLPPAAIVATKAMRADPRAEAHYGERIPYVVVHGEPGARLVDMVVDPLDVLEIDSPYRLNDLYYINKQIIPALQRVYGLLGVELNQWFLEMPRPVRPTLAKRHLYSSNTAYGEDDKQEICKKAQAHRTRIDYYYLSKHCSQCGELVQGSTYLCDKCSKKGPVVAMVMIGKTSKLERDIQHLAAICRHCGGGDWIVESSVKCTSLACSVFYERRKVQKELQALSSVATEMGFYPRCMVEWF